MNVKAIVKEYLERNGFAGLYASVGECGCRNDDLMPCECCPDTCSPGYLGKAVDDEPGFDWIITPDRPAGKEGAG